jgi:inosine-uridine nucleoside N-ribohydrolase
MTDMIKTYLAFFSVLIMMGCSSRVNRSIENNESKLKVIFETDMGNDVDDALALDMLYKYMDAGDIDLLGIMSNKESKYSAEYIDIMNTWYGYPEIPVGIVRNGADCENDARNYTKDVCLMQNSDGGDVFTRSVKDHNKLPEAHLLYRKILAQQPDSSVTIISVGFSTNLARLLDTPGDDFSPLTGRELVARKVKLLSVMAGCFNNDNFFEYNVVKDIDAARKVFTEWPTRLVASPFEVGIAINYPGSSIEKDFEWTEIHPMVEAYKFYQEMPYDRPTWDLTSVLYAVEGASFFGVSPSGKINVTEKGATGFIPDSEGNQFYLSVDSVQAENIKQYFVNLITKQPAKFLK